MEKYETNLSFANSSSRNIYADPVSASTWLGLMISLLVPVMNFALLIVLILNVKNKSIINFAKAGLVLVSLTTGLAILDLLGIF